MKRKISLALLTLAVTACGGERIDPTDHDASSASGAGGSDGSGGHGGGSGGNGGGSGGNDACQTIEPPPGAERPHVSATGTNAAAIVQALDAIFASQTPPIAPGKTYAIPLLQCANLETPLGTTGHGCALELAVDGGEPIAVAVDRPSPLAQDLFQALSAAGSQVCNDPYGENVVVKNMTVSPEAVEYDDTSRLDLEPAPDVVVQGAAAQRVIDAIAAAGIDDCASTGKLFLLCNTVDTGAPSCSSAWLPVEKVGSSELMPVCGPTSATVGGDDLTDAISLALWQSILAAAEDAGYQPLSGTLAQTTVVNADYFSWDGSNLGFRLVTGDAPPPPPPPGP